MNPELFKEIILLGKALEKVSNMEQDLKKLQDGIIQRNENDEEFDLYM